MGLTASRTEITPTLSEVANEEYISKPEGTRLWYGEPKVLTIRKRAKGIYRTR